MDHIEIDGRMIALREAGDGPAVICLHASSSHGGQFSALIGRLSDHYRVIAPDLHGYGVSPPLPDDRRPWWVYDGSLVGALIDLVGPAHLVGHGLGGALAFMVARTRQDVRSLTLYEPTLFPLLHEAADPLIDGPVRAGNALRECLVKGEAEEAARGFTDFWSGRGAFDRLPEDVREYVVLTIGRVESDWAGMEPGVKSGPRLADAQAISCPTLLLSGERTRPSATAIVERLAVSIPHARHKIIEGLGHTGPATHPDAVNPVIEEFLAEVDASAVALSPHG